MKRLHSALSLLPSYAVIAYGCAECPKLSCGREGCDTEFCYHCRQLWHPNQTCDQARRQRARHTSSGNDSSTLYVFNEEAGGGVCLLLIFVTEWRCCLSVLLNKHCQQRSFITRCLCSRRCRGDQTVPSLRRLHHEDQWWQLQPHELHRVCLSVLLAVHAGDHRRALPQVFRLTCCVGLSTAEQS